MINFCSFRSSNGPVGPYAITLTAKSRETLAARDLELFVAHRMDWVEDGLRVVILVMLKGEGKVSDYLRRCYPETFAESQRRTETDDTRRTLLFRLRYLFRCLGLVADHFVEFREERFTDLRKMLDIFCECVRQAVGEKVAVRLEKSIERFACLWKTVNHRLNDEAAVRRELQLMLEDVEDVFEMLREAFMEKESARERERTAERDCADEIAALRAAQEASNRLHRAELRRCAELVAERGSDEDDVYSSLAGLERLSAAKRKELTACFRYSHEHYPVCRDGTPGEHTIRCLAEKVWQLNKTEFEALARIASAPGYKDARSLAAKLYKIASKYPAANHFRWLTQGDFGLPWGFHGVVPHRNQICANPRFALVSAQNICYNHSQMEEEE